MCKKILLYNIIFVLAIFPITSCDSPQEKIKNKLEEKLPTTDESDFKDAIKNPKYISAGSRRSFLITQTNKLWQFEPNSFENKTTTKTKELTNTWEKVSSGIDHSLVVNTDGTLYAWGSNRSGELGLGDTKNRDTPTKVGNDSDWESVSAGPSHSLALKTNGTLYAWGDNGSGELGLGDTKDRNTPTKVGSDSNWKSISTGYHHSFALKIDGTLYAWGNNRSGRLGLGLGDLDTKNIPTKVGNDKNWKSISTGYYHSLALKTNGTLYAWGNNSDGRLGLGLDENIHKNVPTKIGNDKNWTIAITGPYFNFAIKTNGELWGWGNNHGGHLGLGNTDTDDKDAPIQVGTDINWKNVFPGGSWSFAIKTNGELWGWGNEHQLPLIDKEKKSPYKISN